MRRAGYLGGPVPLSGSRGYGCTRATGGWWCAPPSPLDPAEVAFLLSQGMGGAEIARELGALRVHVAETCFVHGLEMARAA